MRRANLLPNAFRLCGIALACALWPAAPAQAVISISAGPGGGGVVVNTLLGADRFYNAGYFGFSSVVSNVEAGSIWNGHETLSQVATYIHDPTIVGTQLGQFDYHATAVGMAIGGQGQFFYYQAGIAPLTQLWSASIGTQFNGDGSFNITDQSFIYAYKQSMQVGRDVNFNVGSGLTFTEHRVADVINSSWGFDEPTGSSFEARTIDALAYTNHTTVVISAGNSGPVGNTVGGPAAGYNKIAVGALAADTTANPYTAPSTFSSRGPNDFYNPQTNTIVPHVRPAVDLAAPGEELALAYYGGTTGTNTGGVDQSAGANNFYLTNAAGTSFSAPIVAGGAALLVDYGRSNFDTHAIDGRVIKAVLLNSADKTAGWDNGQRYQPNTPHIVTTQGLDYATGAGRMNLSRAFDQFTAGTTNNASIAADGSHVKPIGWSFGSAGPGQPSNFIIDPPLTAGQTLTATLTWFVHRGFTDATPTADAIATDDRFDNLNLQIWELLNGLPTTEVAESACLYNNVQHLSFVLPDSAQYLIRVSWAGQQYDLTNLNSSVHPGPEDFALAWSNQSVPEPVGGLVLMTVIVLLQHRRRTVRRVIVLS